MSRAFEGSLPVHTSSPLPSTSCDSAVHTSSPSHAGSFTYLDTLAGPPGAPQLEAYALDGETPELAEVALMPPGSTSYVEQHYDGEVVFERVDGTWKVIRRRSEPLGKPLRFGDALLFYGGFQEAGYVIRTIEGKPVAVQPLAECR